MRALLVSEGKNEQAGALQTLVNRLSPAGIDYESDRVSRNDIHAFHGKGSGYFKRAVRWMREAKRRGCDGLILLIDEDGRGERIEDFNQAQKYAKIELRRAFGVAIRTFDAWMLADEHALTSVLGYQVPRQPNPETVADPKRVCKTLVGASQNQSGLSEIYARLATATDINTIEARCPDGFAPFAMRVRAF